MSSCLFYLLKRLPGGYILNIFFPEDAWLAIRGRVYNITHYLPYHPGGNIMMHDLIYYVL